MRTRSNLGTHFSGMSAVTGTVLPAILGEFLCAVHIVYLGSPGCLQAMSVMRVLIYKGLVFG